MISSALPKPIGCPLVPTLRNVHLYDTCRATRPSPVLVLNGFALRCNKIVQPFRNVVRQSRNSKLATIMTTNYCLYSTCIGIIMVVGCDLLFPWKANSFNELHAVSVLLIVEFPAYCTSSLLSKVCLARCLGCIFTPPTHSWEQKLASCNLLASQQRSHIDAAPQSKAWFCWVFWWSCKLIATMVF